MSAQDAPVSVLTWPKVKLGDVSELCLGKMLDAAKNKGEPHFYLRNPDVRWFDIDTSNLRQMPFESHELDRYGLLAGDVVICEGGEAGRAAIWSAQLPNVKFQKAIHRVRTGPGLLNRFLVHRLKYDFDSGRLADYYTGATIKHLTGRDLARYEFSLPPIPDQHRIVAVLDKAAALSAKRREAITKLDQLLQSVFLEMFGDPVTNPRGWPMVKLAELGEWSSGGTPARSDATNFKGDIPWYSSGELNNVYVGKSDECISPNAVKSSAAKIMRPGSLMIGMYDTAAFKSSFTTVPAACNQAIAFSYLNEKKCDSIYVYQALQLGKEHFKRMQRGVRQKNLNLSLIRDTQIAHPPLAEQQEFSSRFKAIHAQIKMHMKFELSANGLFTSLQQQAFTGGI